MSSTDVDADLRKILAKFNTHIRREGRLQDPTAIVNDFIENRAIAEDALLTWSDRRLQARKDRIVSEIEELDCHSKRYSGTDTQPEEFVSRHQVIKIIGSQSV